MATASGLRIAELVYGAPEAAPNNLNEWNGKRGESEPQVGTDRELSSRA